MAGPAHETTHAASQMAPWRVAIADDDADIRLLVQLALGRDARFEVTVVAHDGLDAVAQIEDCLERDDCPDILLLDLGMPGLDGLQVAERLRACAPQLRIVMYSGYEAGDAAESARRAGVRAFIEKGASPAALLDRLEQVAQ